MRERYNLCRRIVLGAVLLVCGRIELNAAPNAVVKPCSKEDWQFAQSPSAMELTKDMRRNAGGFKSCEAAIVTFLPGVRIVRLRTPVDVDYSLSATLFQTQGEDPLRLISSGRGMVKHPSPESSDSISALNFLLSGVKITPDRETMAAISDLYFFLLDGEDAMSGDWLTGMNREDSGKDANMSVVTFKPGTAAVTYRGGYWHFNFEVNGQSIRLVSVKG